MRRVRMVAAVVAVSLVAGNVAVTAQERDEPPAPPLAVGEPLPSYDDGEEVVELRDEVSKTFATDDPAVFETRLYTYPVHFDVGDDGDDAPTWEEIDTSLERDDDGRFVNVAAEVGVSVAAHSDDAELARLELPEGRSIAFGLQGAERRSGQAEADEDVDAVVFADVAEDVDVRLSSLPTGVKEELVLHSAQVPDRFTFPLRLEGVRAEFDPDTGAVLYRASEADDDEEPVAVTPAGWMEDADGAVSDGVVYRLVEDDTVLEVVVDRDWLDAPERAFPVVVDPTTQTHLYDDAYVREDATGNYASASTLHTGRNSTASYRAFLRFGTGDRGGLVPADGDHTITKATLGLYNDVSATCVASNGTSMSAKAVQVRRVTQSWQGTLITWPGPSVDATTRAWSNLSLGSGSCAAGWHTFDLTALAKEWYAGTHANRGIAVLASASWTDTHRRFVSSDASNSALHPYLDVTWTNTTPAVPTPQTPAAGAMLTAAPTRLVATFDDADGDWGRNRFSLRQRASDGTVTDVWVSVDGEVVGCCSSRSPALPSLVDGVYEWRVRSTDGFASSAWSAWTTFTVDRVKPTTPAVTSSSHPASATWYADAAPVLDWSSSAVSGITGYSYVRDQSATTVPNDTSNGTATTRSYTGLADGEHWFHVKARNGAGVWGDAAHRRIRIDTTPPGVPTTASSTHPSTADWYRDRDVTLSWSATDTAPINGYSWLVDRTATTVPNTSSNGTATSATVTGLVDGVHYLHVRARNSAGLWGDAAHRTVRIDGTAPGGVQLSSSTHPDEEEWYEDRQVTVSWTAATDAGGSGLAGYAVVVDDRPDTVPTALTHTARQLTTTVADGVWWVHVRARDKAGNLGPVSHRAIHVGAGALTAPEDGDRTLRRVALHAAARPGATHVEFDWRRTDGDGWTAIPAGRLALASSPTTPLTSNRLTMGTSGSPELVWDVATTVGGVDGPVQVRARFNGSIQTPPVRLGLDQLGAGKDHASVDLGPGTLNLLTGNLQVTEVDVSVAAPTSDLTVTRTANSRADAGDDLLFGPGWTSSVSVLEAGATWVSIETPGHTSTTSPAPFVLATDLEGATVWFEQVGGDYRPEEGFEDLTLTFASGRYLLTDLDGTRVRFDRVDGTFRPAEVVQAGQAGATTYRYTAVGGKLRPTRIVAASPATSIDCTQTTLVRGCRALQLVYGTTGGGQRLVRVDLTAYDTDRSQMTTTPMATYSYDGSGRLTGVSDPRPAQPLTTGYTYVGSSARLGSVTPPGEEPWQVVYTTESGSEAGRVREVRRADLVGGTARWPVVYGVPLSGSRAPYTMTAVSTARWGQGGGDLPTDATAVFRADAVPASFDPAVLSASSYARAEVHYLDRNARTVNTARPGGRIDAMSYDVHGNVVRELTAANRARALAATDTVATASELSTVRRFDDTGLELLEELGPRHTVELTSGVRAGEQVSARQVTRYVYDEGVPAGVERPVLPTTVRVGALLEDGSTVDVRTTRTGYGWGLRLPTTVTTDPGGLNLVSSTVYDAAGLEIERRQPSEPNGGGPGTLRTVRYTAQANGTHPGCGGRPEWHGQTCLLTPAGQPTVTEGVPGLVTTATVGYDRLLQPTATIETAPTSSGEVSRSTEVSYDAAGRQIRVAVSSSVGVAVPVQTTSYDPASGRAVETATDGQRVVQTFDRLGRMVRYVDASGNVASTTFDSLGRVSTVDDGKGTQTWSYDPTTGLPIRVVDSQAGTWSATAADYDGDGGLRRFTAPQGLTVTSEVDATGATVSQQVTRPVGAGGTAVDYVERVTSSVHGQWVGHDRSGLSRRYVYDAAGRLVRATDDVDGVCRQRRYAFAGTVGRNSNRTSMTTFASNDTGGCAATGTTTSYGYDAGDRLLSGSVYDGFGRTTRLPAALTGVGHGQLEATYHVNDLVQSLSQDGQTRTFALDPTGRFVSEIDQDGQITGWRYGDDTDSPAWLDTPDGWVRPVSGLAGGLGATVTATDDGATSVAVEIVDLFGTVVATSHDRDGHLGLDWTPAVDEFGVPLDGSTDRRHGWLGSQERATVLGSGAVLMGVRVYTPQTGRFLQTDPVIGGSASIYDYCNADPINCTDLDGKAAKRRGLRLFRRNNRHFVIRDGRRAFHWSNHQNRIEWSRSHGWHWNDARRPGSHRPVWRGVARAGWDGLRAGGRGAGRFSRAIGRGGGPYQLIPIPRSVLPQRPRPPMATAARR